MFIDHLFPLIWLFMFLPIFSVRLSFCFSHEYPFISALFIDSLIFSHWSFGGDTSVLSVFHIYNHWPDRGYIFSSLVLLSFSVPVPHCPGYHDFIRNLGVWLGRAPVLNLTELFIVIFLYVLKFFLLYINFNLNLSSTRKSPLRIFIRIARGL